MEECEVESVGVALRKMATHANRIMKDDKFLFQTFNAKGLFCHGTVSNLRLIFVRVTVCFLLVLRFHFPLPISHCHLSICVSFSVL